MIELKVVAGRADEEQLAWIGSLYGGVDPKYTSHSFLRHQFAANPFGWSVHVFALEHGRLVAHTAAVPCRARNGDQEFVAAKVEALVVAESHRGRLADGTSLAVVINERLCEAAHEHGVPVLFALATARANRVFERAGFRPIRHGASSYVLLTASRALDRRRAAAIAAVVLAAAQRVWLTASFAVARLLAGTPAVVVRIASIEDGELIQRQLTDGWTISGTDAWDWYVASGLLRTVEIAGHAGSRAVVRLPTSGEDDAPAQVVAWKPRRSGSLPALLLLGTVANLARATGARTLRFQPWQGTDRDHALARGCRWLGFVRRPIAELELHGDGAFDHVDVSPFFYVTF